jgi:hypothetical protein
LDSSDGGELIIRWQQWSASGAAGSGTSHPDHGVFRVKVQLSDPQYGAFQLLTETFVYNGKTYTNPMELAALIRDSGIIDWVRRSEVQDHMGGMFQRYYPPLDGTCPTVSTDGILGKHEISVDSACQLAIAAQHAGAVACVDGPHWPYAARKRLTYDGYAISTPPGALVFQRGSAYFTFGLQCS